MSELRGQEQRDYLVAKQQLNQIHGRVIAAGMGKGVEQEATHHVRAANHHLDEMARAHAMGQDELKSMSHDSYQDHLRGLMRSIPAEHPAGDQLGADVDSLLVDSHGLGQK